ncbi:MAG: PIG-L family deacetylase [Acidobacteriia bacterium]|nr:PIG-L family deacetylase [Terriglobia bacterium]MBV8902474.1 PIG-L family deacetylase [Terriglobia bacterium]
MQFHKASADLFVPDGQALQAALARTTYLCIAAHQDDIEIMAYHGIAECFGRNDRWFTGVVVTNGAGSPRSGIYGSYTDEEMQHVRLIEQRKAAFVGEYACQVQLGFTSDEVKDPSEKAVVQDLKQILRAAQPEIVYLHNLADKHDTHIAVALRSIAALRELREEVSPSQVYGCEVWRDLDWLPDGDKQVLPASARPNIAAALVGVFDSQVSGGKRYDLATAGRRLAHATYYASHGTDQESALSFAMDLKPLIDNPQLDVGDYVTGSINRFRADVAKRVKCFA